MRVSVVIPVYNAGEFVEKAVISALEQEETFEVLLIEDHSPDNSLEVCTLLAKKYDKVKLYQHPDKGNHGAAATRNLGIVNAQCEHIAFLDADDFYLPGRFKRAKDIFKSDNSVDGVYEAISSFFYSEEAEKKFIARMKKVKRDKAQLLITTIDEAISPEALCGVLIQGKRGWFHFNGVTLRRSVIERAGLLDESMIWNEDNEFFYRLAYYGRLMPGNLEEPVAVRGVHDTNRTLDENEQERINYFNAILWKKMFHFMLEKNLGSEVNKYILNRYLDHYNPEFAKKEITIGRKVQKGFNLIKVLARHPSCIEKLLK